MKGVITAQKFMDVWICDVLDELTSADKVERYCYFSKADKKWQANPHTGLWGTYFYVRRLAGRVLEEKDGNLLDVKMNEFLNAHCTMLVSCSTVVPDEE